MVTNLPKKKVLKAHNLCASLVYTKAIIYFNVGKNRRKKAFPMTLRAKLAGASLLAGLTMPDRLKGRNQTKS